MCNRTSRITDVACYRSGRTLAGSLSSLSVSFRSASFLIVSLYLFFNYPFLGVGAPHQCPLESVASYLCYCMLTFAHFDDSSHSSKVRANRVRQDLYNGRDTESICRPWSPPTLPCVRPMTHRWLIHFVFLLTRKH